jgi:hypothetical protein
MRFPQHTSRCGLALLATACTLLALASAAPAQDLRSPDARDAGLTAISAQDLRSPDARDYAGGRYPATVAGPVPVAETPTAPVAGFDWMDALVGAAAALGLVLLMTAGVLLVRRRTHPDQPAAA